MKKLKFKVETKIAFLLFAISIFFGCQESKITTSENLNGGCLIIHGSITKQIINLDEFDFKNHTYISCKIREGIALTHAGHCWCNIKK
jgi:hypothetical protein